MTILDASVIHTVRIQNGRVVILEKFKGKVIKHTVEGKVTSEELPALGNLSEAHRYE